jgi:general secretion pathway protein K
VHFASEAARIDLNSAAKETLLSFLSALCPDDDKVSEYVEAILSWRKPLKPDTIGNNERGARKFRSPSELWQVTGLPPSVAERALPFVTVYTASPKLDILAGSPQLLTFIPGLQPDRIPDVWAELTSASPNLDRLMGLLGRAQAYVTFEPPRVLRLHVSTEVGHLRRASEVVVLLFDQGSEPFAVLSWNDDPYARL